MPLEARNTTVAVAVTATRVLDMTLPHRTRFAIRNSSAGAQVVTLSFGHNKAPTLLEGFPLLPGEVWAESDSQDYKCFKGEINAISDVAGAVLSVVEA